MEGVGRVGDRRDGSRRGARDGPQAASHDHRRTGRDARPAASRPPPPGVPAEAEVPPAHAPAEDDPQAALDAARDRLRNRADELRREIEDTGPGAPGGG